MAKENTKVNATAIKKRTTLTKNNTNISSSNKISTKNSNNLYLDNPKKETTSIRKKDLLKVKNLNMIFKVRGVYKRGLDNINFSIDEGDFYGVIGESGSGKTTTGKCIIRLYQPSSGVIEFDNKLISQKRLSSSKNKWMRQNIQMIFQDPMSSMDPIHNILKIVSEPLVINKIVQNEARKFIKDILRVNSFFKVEFFLHNRKVLNDIELKYNSSIVTIIQKTIEKIKKINPNKFLKTEDIIEAISFHIDDMLDEYQDLLSKAYKGFEGQRTYIDSLIDRYEKNDLLEIDLELDELNKKIKFHSNRIKYSQSQLEVRKQIKDLIKQKEDYEEDFNNLYFVDNFDLRNVAIHKVKSDISNFRQNLYISKNKIDYLYFLANIKFSQMLKNSLEYVFKNKYLESNEIETINNEITTICTSMMNEVLYLIQNMKNSFDDSDVSKKNEILIFVDGFINILNKLKSKNILSNKNDENEINSETVEWLSEIINYLSLNKCDGSKSKYIKDPKLFFELLNNIKNEYTNLSNERYEKHVQKISNFSLNIQQLKLQEDELKKNFNNVVKYFYSLKLKNELFIEEDKSKRISIFESKSESEISKILSQYKNEFDINNINFFDELVNYTFSFYELKRLTTKRKEVFDERQKLIDGAWNDIKENHKEQDEIDEKIALFKKGYFFHKKELNNLVTRLIKDCSSHEISSIKDFKEKNNIKSLNKSLLKSIQQKFKSLSSIEFEYESCVDRYKLLTKLFNSNNISGHLLYPAIKDLLIKEKVFKALSDVGLKHEHAYRYPHEFSGGQRQRIVIARALITKPKLIIADEPISALDVSIQSQVINIMKKLAEEQGVTIMFIAHDLSMVSYACNKLIIMHNGRIVEKGSVEKIFKNPIHPYTKSLFKSIPELSKIHVNLASFNDVMDYDKDYSPINKPSFYNVGNSDDHQVFVTKDQYDEFVLNKKVKK